MAEPPLARVLTVIAHPDDEVFASGVLCLCADQGFDLTLVCVTDGEGASGRRSAEAGQTRRGELQCSARALGLTRVLFLGLADVAAPDGPGEGGWGERQLVDSLARLMSDAPPDLVLTHGPKGGYGHAAHRITHRAVLAAADQARLQGSVFSFCGRTPGAFFSWHLEGPSAVIVDASCFTDRRSASLDCHASQLDFFVQPHRPRSLRKLLSAAFGYVFIGTEAGRKRVPIGTSRRFFSRFPVEGLELHKAPRQGPHFFARHFPDDRRVTIAR